MRFFESEPRDTLASITASLGQKAHELCKLVVKQVPLGLQVSFTIPEGMCGEDILSIIARNNPRRSGEGIVAHKSPLWKDKGLAIRVERNTDFTFIICEQSRGRDVYAQGSYLKANDMEWVPRWIVTIGAALFRDQNKFPENKKHIGTSADKGDLFKGRTIRTRSGTDKSSVFCSLRSSSSGLSEPLAHSPALYYYFDILAVGTPRGDAGAWGRS